MFKNIALSAKITALEIAAVALHWAARAWYTDPNKFETAVGEELRALADEASERAKHLAAYKSNVEQDETEQ